MTIRPSLKSGTFIHSLATNSEVRVGTRWRYCTLPSSWSGAPTRALLDLCDGTHSLAEIANKTGISSAVVESLVSELCKHDLVDTAKTPISYLRRYNSELGRIDDVTSLDEVTRDFAIETALKRIEMECEGATFNPGDIDGGRSAVLRRREFTLIIFGYGKIVNNLVEIGRAHV